MNGTISLIVSSNKIAIYILLKNCCEQAFLFDNFENFETKFDEILLEYYYPVNVYFDNAQQSFDSDYLVSITSAGFQKALQTKLETAYLEDTLVGYFSVDDKKARQFEKKVFMVSVAKEPLINQVLSKLKTTQNSIFVIASLPVELQLLSGYIKKNYITTKYDNTDTDLRTYNEFDIFIYRTSLGSLRYIIYTNEVFLMNKYTPIEANTTADYIAGVIINEINKILKELDPTIKDQVNILICLDEATNLLLNDLSGQADQLILLTNSHLIKQLNFEVKNENPQMIDQLAMLHLNNSAPITLVVDKEFKSICNIEKLNYYFKWPILIFTLLSIIVFLSFSFVNTHLTKENSITKNEKNLLNEQLLKVQRDYDILVNKTGLSNIMPTYYEVVGKETPLKMIKMLQSLTTKNLEFNDIVWSTNDSDVLNSEYTAQTTIIANIKTDSSHSFASVINSFIISVNSLFPSLIVDFSRIEGDIFDKNNSDHNPLIIKIRSMVEE